MIDAPAEVRRPSIPRTYGISAALNMTRASPYYGACFNLDCRACISDYVGVVPYYRAYFMVDIYGGGGSGTSVQATHRLRARAASWMQASRPCRWAPRYRGLSCTSAMRCAAR